MVVTLIVILIIAATALVKWVRANKRALEPELIQVHPVLPPTGEGGLRAIYGSWYLPLS